MTTMKENEEDSSLKSTLPVSSNVIKSVKRNKLTSLIALKKGSEDDEEGSCNQEIYKTGEKNMNESAGSKRGATDESIEIGDSKKVKGESESGENEPTMSSYKGDKIRENVVEGLKKNLALVFPDFEESRIEKLAVDMEMEMFVVMKDGSGNRYRSKFRSLLFNIKDPKNHILREKIATGEIDAKTLVSLDSAQLANAELSRKIQKLNAENIKDAVVEDVAPDDFVRKSHKGEMPLIDSQEKITDGTDLDPSLPTPIAPSFEFDPISFAEQFPKNSSQIPLSLLPDFLSPTANRRSSFDLHGDDDDNLLGMAEWKWTGCIESSELGLKFEAVVRQIQCGKAEKVVSLLSNPLAVCGKIPTKTAVDYLESVKNRSKSRKVSVFRVSPGHVDNSIFEEFCRIFEAEKGKIAVVSKPHAEVHDMYLFPVRVCTIKDDVFSWPSFFDDEIKATIKNETILPETNSFILFGLLAHNSNNNKKNNNGNPKESKA